MQYRIVEERGADGKVFNYQVQMKFLFLWLPGSIGYSTLDAARKAVANMSGTKTVVPNTGIKPRRSRRIECIVRL